MEGISDIRIVGIDDKRPPTIRKEPYIEIYFKLSHQAPSDWCRHFNNLLSKYPTSPKIKEKEGLYIETWVRTPEEIFALVELLKSTVAHCTRQYIERVELSTRTAGKTDAHMAQLESGPQGRLNKIIAALDFADVNSQQ